ncbi:SPOR domain-containing protein [Paracoccus chinensis]|uniref:Sporulation related domain-containing protein n=1 Tax=Paracoccus chinensis TaxID=525640 RepID=A0A1G9IUT8_9RHOB|nr:SPOR domain-containing protein [Paracoccus chinensis]SDL29109.1 Sporulation related domain-containing protein [Paracoccus chinensis]
MGISGFSLLLAAVAALAALANVAVPANAGQPGEGMRRIEVPASELSPALRPAEMPPPDFTAGQYIDSAGCVFVRTDRGWRGRIDRDGAAVCGYPPTLSARRTGPDSEPALFPEPELPRAARIERELTQAIIPNLQAAELAEGNPPRKAREGSGNPDPGALGIPQAPQGEAPPDPLQIGAMVTQAPALSREMAGPGRIDRLCALIGGDGSAQDGASLGLCGGTTSLASLARVSPGRKGNGEAGRSAAETGGTKGGPPNAGAKKQKAKVAASGGSGASRAGASAKALPPDDMRMIPPGARFVQVGSFRKAGQAQAAAGTLARMGVPVVRGKEGGAELVMVGPLDGREAIVRMIERLRRAGYRDLRARR